jgi:hypothetical protein
VGLTLPELVSIVGTITGVASAYGIAAARENGKSGKGAVMKLDFQGDYLMTPSGVSDLGNISRALFFIEMDRLNALYGSGDNEDALRQTAVGNVKQKVIGVLDANATMFEGSFVANGEGGLVKDPPWGEVKVKLHGGYAYPTAFDPMIYKAAQQHGVNIPTTKVEFVKSCLVDYDFEMNPGFISDDDIYVRGQNLIFNEGEDGRIWISCTVAFDWDGNTSYFDWIDDRAMSPNFGIPEPRWKGPKDPDD